MTVRQFGDGWQADFYAYGERIRKVFPIKRDATAYEGKMKASIRENRFFDVKQEAFQVFKESDTPRKAGGLMSGAASKAVDPIAKRRAKARLCYQT
jgi:hypothetical protein